MNKSLQRAEAESWHMRAGERRHTEAVKDTPEFQSLQTKEERLHYLEEAAAKQAGASDIETAATNGYVNLGGEKMARQTAKRWYYTKDQREKTWPDVAGNVLDKSVESQRIVERWKG